MATRNTTNVLIPPKAPNLLNAPTQYSRSYIDQLLNVLRLYFNTIDNFDQQFIAETGGGYLKFPNIAAGNATNQYATANNTPTIVAWDTEYSSNGFTLNVDNTATANVPGYYKITYSAQIANISNSPDDAIFWLRVNGVDVPASTTIFTVPARKSAGVPSFVCGYSEVVFEINAGDTIGLWWGTPVAATSGGVDGIYLHYKTEQTTPMPYPEIPSVIGSITFVSALY